jgi:hypothetical protein
MGGFRSGIDASGEEKQQKNRQVSQGARHGFLFHVRRFDTIPLFFTSVYLFDFARR